jgi:hypothetical protein
MRPHAEAKAAAKPVEEPHAGVAQPPGVLEGRREPDMVSPAGIPTRPGHTSNFFTSRRPTLSDDVDIFTSFRQVGGATPPEKPAKAPIHEPREDTAAHLFERGLLSLRKGQYGEALTSWEAAAALAPENRVYLTNIRRLKKLLEAM